MTASGRVETSGIQHSQRLALTAPVRQRSEILQEMRRTRHVAMDALFVRLLIAQWVLAMIVAHALTPWDGTGPHFGLAVFAGAAINVAPVTLILLRPGWWVTRHAVAASQMLWSAMLILITSGRIETHFHIFGSLAFLALYRDRNVIATATVVISADLLVRGALWPQSVYGDPSAPWWEFFEHAGWIAFEAAILIVACTRFLAEDRITAAKQARLERTASIIERHVVERTAELQEVAERYRALVENTDAVTFELDLASRRMRYVSPQASRLLDCSPRDLEDPAFLATLLHPEDRARVGTELAQLAAGERSWSDPLEGRLVTRGGRVVHVRTFLTSQDGSRRIRAIALDVTRQRQRESELQLAQKLESVGRLAAGVAHEINTPIQVVGDSVQFLAQSMDDVMALLAKHEVVVERLLAGKPAAELVGPARAARALAAEVDLPYILEQVPTAAERAIEGVERVGTIVRSMKVFAHTPSEVMAPADLNRAVKDALTIARSEYRYVASIATELGELPPVMCHASEIIQVVLNLVMNATQAIAAIHAETGTWGLITVKTRTVGDHVEISIADTGGGISDEIRDRVFDPFFTTRDVGHGSGQGLPIARAVIVERHRGRLTFETQAGYGTTFHIQLPIAARASARSIAA